MKPDEAKAALIDKTLEHAHAKLPEDQAARLEALIRIYYGAVAPEDLLERSAADLYGAALAQLNFGTRRAPGEAKVRVYTPQLEEHGWTSGHTVVEIVNDDMPFLVDSVSMELNRLGSGVHLIIHPVVRVRRDETGQLLDVLPFDTPAEDAQLESFLHAEVVRETEPAHLERLRAGLERVLADVRAAVEDWPAMVERAHEVIADVERVPPSIDPEELAESKALLEWIVDNHFTFLGYREYDLVSENGEHGLRRVPGTGLGILRNGDDEAAEGVVKLAPEAVALARAKDPLVLTKANSRATVHRPSYLDYVGVKRFDESGEVVGERRFLGLYTSTAYSASPHDIPLLRRKVRKVRERSGLPPGSHDDKALLEVLESLPRDELFQISDDDLFDIAMGIVRLGERQQVRLFVRKDTFGRFLSCLVYVPRERFNTQVREKIEDILQEVFEGVSADYTVRLSESVLARMHFVIYTRPGATLEYDVPEIEARLVEATRSWVDDLGDALVEHLGEERGTELFALYRDAFPAAYRDDFTTEAAVLDVERMERLDPEGDLAMTLYRPLEAEPDFFVLKLLRSGQPILLSDVLPLLEDMGVKVFDERPYEIDRAGPVDAWIYDFGLDARRRRSRPRSRGRGVQGRVRAGVARRDRGRRVQPPRAQRRSHLAGDRRAPCAREVPAPGGQHVQPDLYGGDTRRQPGDRPQARRLLPDPLRPRSRGRSRTTKLVRSPSGSRRRSTPSRASTTTGSCAASSGSFRPRCGRTTSSSATRGRRSRTSRSSSTPSSSPTCRSRGRCTRSGSTRRARRASTCAAARSPAAASAGRIAARISARRSSG